MRKHCLELGFDSLVKLSWGTVFKILSEDKIKTHKIQYYLERRDPELDQKIIQVLHVYKEVHIISERGEDSLSAYISFDEKPGIRSIENTVPDLPPSPVKHVTVCRDHEYVRHGTLSLLAGIDFLTGEVIATVEDRHRSQEAINFLKKLDAHYSDKKRITIVLDNHIVMLFWNRYTRGYLIENVDTTTN